MIFNFWWSLNFRAFWGDPQTNPGMIYFLYLPVLYQLRYHNIKKKHPKTMHHNSRSDRGRKNIYCSSCIQMTSSPHFEKALFHRFSMGTPVFFREKNTSHGPKIRDKKRRKAKIWWFPTLRINSNTCIFQPIAYIGTGIITTICLIFMGILQPITYMGLVYLPTATFGWSLWYQ